jgi:hypothetical protein
MTATISRHWRLRAIRLMAVTFATLLAPAGHAQPTPPTTEAPTSTPSASTKATTTMTREEWEKAIARVPQGKEGCFKATYPHLEWQEVPCTTPQTACIPLAHGHRLETVGSSNDCAAEVTGTLSAAEGSFDSVTGVTSESGKVGGSPPEQANVFSLQLNTRPFTTSQYRCASCRNAYDTRRVRKAHCR